MTQWKRVQPSSVDFPSPTEHCLEIENDVVQQHLTYLGAVVSIKMPAGSNTLGMKQLVPFNCLYSICFGFPSAL